jgi:chitodextrinase
MGTSKTYAYWASVIVSPNNVTTTENISVGVWPFEVVEEWVKKAGYVIGDRFTYDGKLWEVRASGNYNRPPGQGNNLQPYGVYQEITDEYRDYNTYFAGDIVIHNGAQYEALYNGMSGQEPGTVTGWQEITDEYREYNVYTVGDIVIYNGAEYEAIYGGMSGQEPGTVVGWQELTDEWRFFNVYQGEDVVIFNGDTYQAQWYTQGNEPDTSNVWVLQN